MSETERKEEGILLARLDERVDALYKDNRIIHKRFNAYVTNERFRPIEMIAYGLAGGVLITILGLFLGSITLGG